jgi:dTDP-4-amino-4,6-dideoxygalactose transaminase
VNRRGILGVDGEEGWSLKRQPRAVEKLAIDGGVPVRSGFLLFGSPAIGEEEIQEVVDTLRSGWLGTGPRVKRFEEDFRSYAGARHAIALNSCTAGMHLALLAAGVGPGDEVIVPTLTFAATANVVVHTGATPVLVDVDPRTMNVDPALLEARLTPRTKAILPVHFAGRGCDMDRILALARPRGLRVIEDAAHAAETVCAGRKVGSIGDATCFSFYVTKNVMTGEGGMVTTDDDAWAERMRVLSLHGMSRDAWKRYSGSGYAHYEVLMPGFKYNMMDVQAALGIHQLARVNEYASTRRRIWEAYDAAFADLPASLPAPEDPGSVHARHLYTLLLDLGRLRADRDTVMAALKAEGIGTGVHFIALHLHPYYRDRFSLKPSDFPVATQISRRTISIPLSAKLTPADANDVIAAVRKVLLGYAA